MLTVIEDRREKTSEKISALTGEIGVTVAQLILLWPWQRVKARVLATHLGKLYGDLHAELGDRATSMAARAVTRPLEAATKRIDALEQEQEKQDTRLSALEAGDHAG